MLVGALLSDLISKARVAGIRHPYIHHFKNPRFQLDSSRSADDAHRMLTTHEDVVDVHPQTKADMRRFNPSLACLQVKIIALEGRDLAHKAALANCFTRPPHDCET